MADNIHIQSGSATPTPRVIKEQSRARNSYAKIIIAGIVLVVLTLSYVGAVFSSRLDASSQLLILIGTGLGYLLGTKDKTDEEN